MKSLCVLRTASRARSFGARSFAAGLPALCEAAGLGAAECVLSGTEVRGQAMPAALPSVTRLLVTAKWAGRVEPVIGIGPDHAGPQALRHPQDPAALVSPDPRRQAIRGVVGLGHRFIRCAEGQDREHRAEDLLPRNAMRLAHASEQSRREPEPLVGKLARR